MKYFILFFLSTLVYSHASQPKSTKVLDAYFNKSQNLVPAQVSQTKEEILSFLAVELQKGEEINLRLMSHHLYAAGEHLEKEFDRDFLGKLLPHYKIILGQDPTHTYVEMFVQSYDKNREAFDQLIDQALDQESRADFRSRLEASRQEAIEGQG
jgi:hypothetical protein